MCTWPWRHDWLHVGIIYREALPLPQERVILQTYKHKMRCAMQANQIVRLPAKVLLGMLQATKSCGQKKHSRLTHILQTLCNTSKQCSPCCIEHVRGTGLQQSHTRLEFCNVYASDCCTSHGQTLTVMTTMQQNVCFCFLRAVTMTIRHALKSTSFSCRVHVVPHHSQMMF